MRQTASHRDVFAAEDVSAVVSVSIDSPERRRNLRMWVAYVSAAARGAEVVVVEQSAVSRIGALASVPGVRHVLVPDADSHWKTRNLNLGAAVATRPVLMLIDCDVLLPVPAMTEAAEAVRNRGGFVQPFNGVMAQFRESIIDDTTDPAALMRQPPHFAREAGAPELNCTVAAPLYGGSGYHATGGAMVCDRSAFFLAGGYNENFISYGFEDMEFFERVNRLAEGGVAILHRYNAYHLPHPRGAQSTYNNFYRANEAEYERVRNMDGEILRRYALNRFRALRFDADRELHVSQDHDHYRVELRADARVSLKDLDIAIVVSSEHGRCARLPLERVLDFLEAGFSGYRVTLYEIGSRWLRHPSNQKNYVHTWLNAAEHDLNSARALACSRLVRPLVHFEIIDGEFEPGALLKRLESCVRDGEPARHFSKAREAGPPVASTNLA